VKSSFSPDAPFAVSIRLSNDTVSTLATRDDERAKLREFLDAEGLYVYTANAFPYGPFKGQQVMEQVYEPDWATDDRTRYTRAVADVMAAIAPDHISPSIQTAPLAFRPNVSGPAYVDGLTRNLLSVVAYLADLESRTGRRVKLALEPEPACFLETTAETVRYFEDRLYSTAGTTLLADLTGRPASEAEGLVRRHLGVVFDIGHQSVQFEDIDASLRSLLAAGIPIFKLQEAAALRVPEVTADTVEALRRFTDTIYLSQTTVRRGDSLTRHLNLADAIAEWEAAPAAQRAGDVEWRTHFHVPVFLDDLGDGLRTTRPGVDAALALHGEIPLSDHLEIETYTWDVLPAHLKTGDITEYVVRELEYVNGRLTSPDPASVPVA
jgi:hypothetical protein